MMYPIIRATCVEPWRRTIIVIVLLLSKNVTEQRSLSKYRVYLAGRDYRNDRDPHSFRKLATKPIINVKCGAAPLNIEHYRTEFSQNFPLIAISIATFICPVF